MRTMLFVGGIFCALISMSQAFYTVEFPDVDLKLDNSRFYVEKVMDKRENTSLGVLQFGPAGQPIEAQLSEGFFQQVSQLLDSAIDRKEGQLPMVIHIRELLISDESTGSLKSVSARLRLEYYYQNQYVFETDKTVTMEGTDFLDKHGENIVDAFEASLLEFNKSYVMRELSGDKVYFEEETNEVVNGNIAVSQEDPIHESIQSRLSSGESDFDEEGDRNVMALGYQIGGLTLVGVDYEVRMNDVLGVHFGAGLSGFTAGLKLHADASKDSKFLNLSLKDGGFGLIKTAAAEYGWRMVGRNEGGTGFHGQIGLARVLYIDEDFEEKLFGSNGAPALILSLGLGVSW